MGNLFGVRRHRPVVSQQDKAILQLKQQRDKIKIYQKKTESDLEKNKELALKLFQNGMQDRALIIMRRKKFMEEILNRTDKQLETLEQLVIDIEYTQIEVSVVEGLKVGSEALKQLNSLMDIDDIQKMMEDNEEAAEKQKQITELLARSSERYDDDDLLRELDGYKDKDQDKEKQQHQEAEQSQQDILNDNLPTVPEQTVITEQPTTSKDNQEPTIEDPLELPDVPAEEPAKEIKKIKRIDERQPQIG